MLLRKLNSRLHLIDDPGNKSSISFLGYTDYAGDVANFLINKPAYYRIFYYPDSDLYVIGDSSGFTHYDFYRVATILGLIDPSTPFSRSEDYSSYEVGSRLQFVPMDEESLDSLYWEAGMTVDDIQLEILRGTAAQLTTGYLLGSLKDVPDLMTVLRQRQAIVKAK